MKTILTVSALVFGTAVSAGSAVAMDRVAPASVLVTQAQSEAPRAEPIAIEIRSGREILWSGTLRIGGNYGNANFSQSTNEYPMPCPGEAFDPSKSRSTSQQLRFNLNRHNWQQTPNRFNINVNWTRPLAACEGEGTNSIGFTRIIDIPRGQTTTVEGEGSLVVRMTRQP